MSKLRTILVLITVVATAFCGYAYSTQSVKLVKKTSSNKPHSPGSIYVECYYENGKLSFSMPSGVEYLYVTITDEDSGAQSSAFVYSENDEVDLPSNGINYYITVTTNTNITFEGELPIINN